MRATRRTEPRTRAFRRCWWRSNKLPRKERKERRIFIIASSRLARQTKAKISFSSGARERARAARAHSISYTCHVRVSSVRCAGGGALLAPQARASRAPRRAGARRPRARGATEPAPAEARRAGLTEPRAWYRRSADMAGRRRAGRQSAFRYQHCGTRVVAARQAGMKRRVRPVAVAHLPSRR